MPWFFVYVWGAGGVGSRVGGMWAESSVNGLHRLALTHTTHAHACILYISTSFSFMV
jgi:hypothetical protein